MAHTIVDPAKLTVTEVITNLAAMDADVQTSLRTLVAGDKLIEITYTRNLNSNDVVVNIIWEDQ